MPTQAAAQPGGGGSLARTCGPSAVAPSTAPPAALHLQGLVPHRNLGLVAVSRRWAVRGRSGLLVGGVVVGRCRIHLASGKTGVIAAAAAFTCAIAALLNFALGVGVVRTTAFACAITAIIDRTLVVGGVSSSLSRFQ
ncbi:hypothetical protein VaNZ11_015250 [Volvox africanus]|uniref:Uncharacterized protein n=1 Tax=Volvox africanus TaxID=51714 RepID=A0ABQ5SL04_9CHLO|nr:hypothetical protein VaNZ11_015250 [Volvox africanus]